MGREYSMNGGVGGEECMYVIREKSRKKETAEKTKM
jgi:hypothetical protein